MTNVHTRLRCGLCRALGRARGAAGRSRVWRGCRRVETPRTRRRARTRSGGRRAAGRAVAMRRGAAPRGPWLPRVVRSRAGGSSTPTGGEWRRVWRQRDSGCTDSVARRDVHGIAVGVMVRLVARPVSPKHRDCVVARHGRGSAMRRRGKKPRRRPPRASPQRGERPTIIDRNGTRGFRWLSTTVLPRPKLKSRFQRPASARRSHHSSVTTRPRYADRLPSHTHRLVSPHGAPSGAVVLPHRLGRVTCSSFRACAWRASS